MIRAAKLRVRTAPKARGQRRLFALVATGALVASCGESKTAGANSKPQPHVDAVVVSPDRVDLNPGDLFRFHALVEGSAGISQAVDWSVESGTPRDLGTIAPDGTYHAPLATNGPVNIVARSVADPGKQGQAVVKLPTYSFVITPAEAHVFTGETLQFVVATTGLVNPPIYWRALAGHIDANGLYHAPEFPTEDWISAGMDVATVNATVHVVIFHRPPVLESISAAGAPGETITLTGSYIANAFVDFSGSLGQPIRAREGLSDIQFRVIVPVGAASGPLFLEVLGMKEQGILTSNSLFFQRAPRILLRPLPRALALGESVPLQIAWIGEGGPLPVTYDADLGTTANGIYTAPSLAGPRVAHVRACVTGTSNCSQTAVTLKPLRIEPSFAVVSAGRTLDLTAISAGGGATFVQLAGGGTLTQDGHYTAPTTLEESGQQWIGARTASAVDAVQIGVSGLHPGLLGRFVDNIDQTRIDPATATGHGASVESVALAGGKAYVLRRTLSELLERGYFDAGAFHWIDTYDLADPQRPAWIESVECPTHATELFGIGSRLYAWGRMDTPGLPIDGKIAWYESLAVFDVGGGHPVLFGGRVLPSGNVGFAWRASHDDEKLAILDTSYDDGANVHLRVYKASATDPLSPRLLTLPLPESARSRGAYSFAIWGDRVYATHPIIDSSGLVPRTIGLGIGVWDIANGGSTLLGSVQIPDNTLDIFPLTAAGPLLIHGRQLFDRRSNLPVPSGQLPLPYYALATLDHRALLQDLNGALAVLDLADVSAPRIVTTLDRSSWAAPTAAWKNDVVYAPQGRAGLGLYDTSSAGGPLARSALTTYPNGSEAVFGATIVGPYLYATGAFWPLGTRDPTSMLAVWDLSAAPARLVWRSPEPPAHTDGNIGLSLGVSGVRLVEGNSRNLVIWSITDPAHPVKTASIPVDVSALLVQGSIAWVGTAEGDLISFDLNATHGPSEVGRVVLGAYVSALTAAGPGRLAVALRTPDTGDVGMVDVSNPALPALLGLAGIGSPMNAVAVNGATAFAAGRVGLVSIDISDSLHLSTRAVEPLPNIDTYPLFDGTPEAISVALQGDLAWVGALEQAAAFYAYDVRNPGRPRLVSKGLTGTSWNRGYGGYGMLFDGSRAFQYGAFLGGSDTGMFEFDVTQPRNVITHWQPDPALLRRVGVAY